MHYHNPSLELLNQFKGRFSIFCGFVFIYNLNTDMIQAISANGQRLIKCNKELNINKILKSLFLSVQCISVIIFVTNAAVFQQMLTKKD